MSDLRSDGTRWTHTPDDGPDPYKGRRCQDCGIEILHREDAVVDGPNIWCEGCAREIQEMVEDRARGG